MCYKEEFKMKYTKGFKDTETGAVYYLSEYYFESDGCTRYLVLLSLDKKDVVEVSNNYKGTTVKQVGWVQGNYMELSIDDFEKRFVEVE